MNNRRPSGQRRGSAAELRFMTVHPGADQVAFDGRSNDGTLHRFSISTQALSVIAGDNCPAGLQPIQLFERCKPAIFGAASRAFDAGVRGDPIVLSADYFRRSVATR